jgi:AraC-like DNA-binding protein
MNLAYSAQMLSPTQHLGILRQRITPEWRLTRHSHPHVEILILLHGSLSIHLDTEDLVLGTGDVIYYPPGQMHREEIAPGHSVDLFNLVCHAGHTPAIPVVTDIHGRIRMLAQWLYDETISATTPRQPLLNAFVSALQAEMNSIAEDHAINPLVLAVRTYLREHIDQPLSVADIARHVSMSVAHFTRTYKRLTGNTPWDDLLRLRVDVTRNLLITTRYPLREIAPQVGFHDEYHLSRIFRRYMGVSPGFYRRHGKSADTIG